MSEHVHGSMSTYDHEKTYKGFIKLGKVTAGIVIAILVFLAIFNT